MQKLNLPEYDFVIRENNGKHNIFDPIRKKFVALTPEEWVRQNFLQYLISEKQFPASLLRVEAFFKVNRLQLRTDILASNPQGDPLLIVECKAPEIKITQEVFDQAAKYNLKWKSPYLAVTNGLVHFCSHIDFQKHQYTFLHDIPSYPEIKSGKT